MNWQDILIQQAITTVIAIASSSDGKGKFRRALLKVFRTIAQQVATVEELQNALTEKGGR